MRVSHVDSEASPRKSGNATNARRVRLLHDVLGFDVVPQDRSRDAVQPAIMLCHDAAKRIFVAAFGALDYPPLCERNPGMSQECGRSVHQRPCNGHAVLPGAFRSWSIGCIGDEKVSGIVGNLGSFHGFSALIGSFVPRFHGSSIDRKHGQ